MTILGRVSRDELLGRMSSSQIFILNSSFESFSFQAVEAMALGLVVVSSDSGSLQEIIEDGVSGILFKTDNPSSIVPLLKDLYQDQDKRRHLSLNAVKRASLYSFENTIRELKKIL